MNPLSESDFNAAYERVLNTYLAIGCPESFVTRQAIGRIDARALVDAIVSQQPRSIVEVGTFVGLSTMLMALAVPQAKIWTIDPDPLLEESWHAARGDGAFPSSLQTTVQAVGREAARRLGVEDRVTFVRGGFSCADTYLSTEGVGEGSSVVGASLLSQLGAVDLFFIDGLHYEDAVFADLDLAARHLAPDGAIVLHDTIGMWGTNVRSAVRRFLGTRNQWSFRHPPLAQLNRSIGLVGQNRAGLTSEAARESWLDQPIIASRVASELCRTHALKRVGVLGRSGAIVEQLAAEIGAPIEQVELSNAPATRFDLVLVLPDADAPPMDPDAVAAWSSSHATTLVVANAPPGEDGAAPSHGWSRSAWVRSMRQVGFESDDALARCVDPWVYAAGPIAKLAPTNTRDLSLLAFHRDRDSALSDGAAQDRIEDLLATIVQLNAAIARQHAHTGELERLYRESQQRQVDLERQLSESQALHRADLQLLQECKPDADAMKRLTAASGPFASFTRRLARWVFRTSPTP